MMQVSGGTCFNHGDWVGPGCPKCNPFVVAYPEVRITDITTNSHEYQKKALKLRPNLLPYEAVIEGIKAMEFGAQKYGADQWREVDMKPIDFLNALERHLLAYKSGEKLAEDSQVSHLGHIIANCAILLVKFDQADKK